MQVFLQGGRLVVTDIPLDHVVGRIQIVHFEVVMIDDRDRAHAERNKLMRNGRAISSPANKQDPRTGELVMHLFTEGASRAAEALQVARRKSVAPMNFARNAE